MAVCPAVTHGRARFVPRLARTTGLRLEFAERASTMRILYFLISARILIVRCAVLPEFARFVMGAESDTAGMTTPWQGYCQVG